MKLKFLNPNNIERNIKATVHRSGKMGFTLEAARKMGLTTEKSLSIAINDDDKEDRSLYVVVNESRDMDAYPILKAGQYLYANLTPLFDSLGVDYKKYAIFYDISEERFENALIFRFKRREKQRIGKESQ